MVTTQMTPIFPPTLSALSVGIYYISRPSKFKFFNWDSLHARLNIATMRHGVPRKKYKKIEVYRKSV